MATTAQPARHRILWLMPLAGALLALSFPNEVIPGRWGDHPPALIAWLALALFLSVVLRLSDGAARWAAGLFGLGFALVTFSWVRLFGYLPWALLACYMAVTPLLAISIAQQMPARKWAFPVNLALAWAGMEWLHAQGIFGLSWSEVGASQVDGVFSSLASLGGVPFISFVLLAAVSALVQRVRGVEVPKWLLPMIIGFTLCAAIAGFVQTQVSLTNWQSAPTSRQVIVVQPNSLRGLTPADLKPITTDEDFRRWTIQCRERLETLVQLSLQATGRVNPFVRSSTPPSLVIWPESAVPGAPMPSQVIQFPQISGSMLLYGARYEEYLPDGNVRPRNSAYLLDPQGRVVARYDKIHLVPFGEFVPMRRLVERYYTVRDTDIRPGERRQVLNADGLPIGVGICFESTLSSIARMYAGQKAGVLVYITNDAWFHRTSAVRQHWNQARFRAIETGLPVARSASTGISGFIAPDGHSLAEIPVYTGGTRTYDLKPGIPGTLFTHGGWLFGPFSLFASLLLAIIGIIGRRRTSSKPNMTPMPR